MTAVRIFDADQIERDLSYTRQLKTTLEFLFNTPGVREHVDQDRAMADFVRLNQIEKRIAAHEQGASIERTIEDLEGLLH